MGRRLLVLWPVMGLVALTGCAGIRDDILILTPTQARQCVDVATVTGSSYGSLASALADAQNRAAEKRANAIWVVADSGAPAQTHGLVRLMMQDRTVIAMALHCPPDFLRPKPAAAQTLIQMDPAVGHCLTDRIDTVLRARGLTSDEFEQRAATRLEGLEMSVENDRAFLDELAHHTEHCAELIVYFYLDAPVDELRRIAPLPPLEIRRAVQRADAFLIMSEHTRPQ